jgi:hypothetical protein
MMVKTPWDVEFSVPYITDVNMIHPPDKKDLPPCTGNSGYYGDENAVSKVVRGIFNGGQACQD